MGCFNVGIEALSVEAAEEAEGEAGSGKAGGGAAASAAVLTYRPELLLPLADEGVPDPNPKIPPPDVDDLARLVADPEGVDAADPAAPAPPCCVAGGSLMYMLTTSALRSSTFQEGHAARIGHTRHSKHTRNRQQANHSAFTQGSGARSPMARMHDCLLTSGAGCNSVVLTFCNAPAVLFLTCSPWNGW